MGAQVSNASATVENLVKGSIEAVMDTTVKGDVNVACSNLQIVDNVRNCNVNFAEQMCEAVAISNLTSNQSMESEVSQDVMNHITSKVEASTEGQLLLMAQVSNTSNVVKNEVDLAMTATQTFNTSCTRNISAINEQVVRNTECTKQEINFAPQMVSGEVIGDCVANHVGNLTAAQKMTNVLDLATTSTAKGLDIWAFIMMIAGFLLIFILGIPMFIYGMRYAISGSTGGQISAKSKGKYYAVIFVFTMILLSAVIWWPGFFSIFLGINPWPYVGVVDVGGLAPLCREDKNIDPDVFINSWMWYDPHCLSLPGNTYCSEDNKVKSYNQCGLFATNFGCNDSRFKDDEGQYKNMLRICGKVAGHPFSKCTTADIALNVFSQEEGDYGKCVKCTETSGAAFGNYGLWRKEGASCSSGIDKTAYIRTPGEPCSSSDLGNCKENKEQFNEVSPNECDDSGYHARKKKFSQYWRACLDIEKHGKVTEATVGEVPLLAQQCPPDPFDYFTKCDRANKTCKYTAKGCVNCDANGDCDCSAADHRTVASCHNNLSACCFTNENGDRECNDPDYEKDLLVYEAANDTCKKRWESRNYFNPWGWIVPLVLYILGIFYIGWILVKDSDGQRLRQGMTQAWSFPGVRKARNTTVLVFIVVCVLASGFPIGMLAVAYAGEPYSIYDKDIHKRMDSFDPDTAMYVGYPIFAISCLALIYQVVQLLRAPAQSAVLTQAA